MYCVAGATKYEWEFSDINGFYASKTSPTNYIGLHGILPILDWGTTWSVRVRAYIDDVQECIVHHVLLELLPTQL
jgi:hypothetical protein